MKSKPYFRRDKCEVCGHTQEYHAKYGVTCGTTGGMKFVKKQRSKNRKKSEE